MSEPELEELFPLADAPRFLPRRRGRKKPHVSTMHRWASKGLQGVTLQTVSVGGTRCTSRRMLKEFFARLTEKRNHAMKSVSADDPASEDTVEEDLKALGL